MNIAEKLLKAGYKAMTVNGKTVYHKAGGVNLYEGWSRS